MIPLHRRPAERLWPALCLALLLPAACSPARAVAQGRPPALDDRWLARFAHDLVRSAAADNGFDAARERIDALLLARLCCTPKPGDLETLTELVFARRACRYLPAAGKLAAPRDGPKFAAWLLARPEVARLLYRALGDVADPDAALGRLADLVAADEKAVLAWPDLAVAFATTVPGEGPRAQPDPAGLVESFRWYVAPDARLHADLRKVPFEVLRFVADTRLSIAERKWVVATYGGAAAPHRAYFDIAYDMDHLLQGKPRLNEKAEYSLPNLRRFGGVCHDQAYFAGEVCKALGIPATVVYGRGGSGVPHSWFAYFKSRRGDADGGTWDAQTGRYQEHLYLMGLVRDPAGGEKIPDTVLSALGAATKLPVERRERADAAVALAGMVYDAFKAGRKADPAVLKAAAADYAAKADAAAPKAVTTWVAARRVPDASLAEDLIGAALNQNLVHTPAWDLIVELRQADALPVARTGRFLSVLISQTAKTHPDYSYTWVMKLAATLPDRTGREAVYTQAMSIYAARADLQGRLMIALGDEARDGGDTARAAKYYEDAAIKCVRLAEIVVRAAGKAEDLHVAAGRRDQAINLYLKLYRACRKDPQAGIFRPQTAHYQLGARLAELYKAAGQEPLARQIRNEIE
jgi:hypothetical protein